MTTEEMFRLEFARLELEGRMLERMESRAKLAEPALHIPQRRQPKICPQCGGNLVEMYQADVYICNDCGIKVTTP